MEELLEVIVKNVVTCPDKVSFETSQSEKGIFIKVTVDDSDKGRVIGKDGKIARAIRAVLKAVAAKEKKRIYIEFI